MLPGVSERRNPRSARSKMNRRGVADHAAGVIVLIDAIGHVG